MKRTDLDACTKLVKVLAVELPSLARDRDSLDAANLRRRCGELKAFAGLYVQRREVLGVVVECLVLAENAGGDLFAFGEFRRFVVALQARAGVATELKRAFVRMALAYECRAVVRTTFNSRADAEELQTSLNLVFEMESDAAAAETDPTSWRLLVALHVNMSGHLATVARVLPRVVPYRTMDRKPSLWIAQKLFTDGSRSDELISENRAIHPLFMPMDGIALSR